MMDAGSGHDLAAKNMSKILSLLVPLSLSAISHPLLIPI